MCSQNDWLKETENITRKEENTGKMAKERDIENIVGKEKNLK